MFGLITRDDFYNDFFNGNFGLEGKNKLVTDVSEKDGVYTISANLAGYDKENIKVEFNDGYLMITAVKSEKEEGDKDNYYLKESHSSVSRSFYLGENFTDEDFNAEFKDGLLNITYKDKPEPDKSIKQIEVK